MGWGQRHPLDGVELTRRIFGWTLPKEYLLLYTPRTEEELQTVMEIVKASAGYMTNTPFDVLHPPRGHSPATFDSNAIIEPQ
jgi:hypothetical protein